MGIQPSEKLPVLQKCATWPSGPTGPLPPSASARQAIQPALKTASQARTARPTCGSHEQQPGSERSKARPCDCRALLTVARKGRKAVERIESL